MNANLLFDRLQDSSEGRADPPCAAAADAAPEDSATPLYRLGAELLATGGVRFRLWAPACKQLSIALYDPAGAERPQLLRMHAIGDGWHALHEPLAQAGWRYHFVLPDGQRVPDPASRFQPEDVHGPSEIIDAGAYRWSDAQWRGMPWHTAIIYEVHVGTFTAQGTFAALAGRLDHLVQLGITALQLMPIADFPGVCNWGYDGALLYAPDSTYGRPEHLKALVDAAHARGLMVFLDVVYNHFGPDGNYMSLYAPALFTDRHHTPWGAAINFDGPDSREVREFVINNALYWLTEFHLDGLRLDAVHAIIDDSDKHLLDELAERVHRACPWAHLILENEENEAFRLSRDSEGAPTHFTAQWNEDLHHVLHVAVTGEAEGYYADYIGEPKKMSRALAEGFSFQGEIMPFRGRPRGEPSATLPPPAFVAFIQNHDQIGNRAFGDRLTQCAPVAAVRAIAAIYLLLPQVPMIFMGEEWGAAQPFPFFCDFPGELGENVRQGRRQEFAKFPQFQDEHVRAQIPDPQAVETFESAKLAWDDLSKPEHAQWLELYRQLTAVRHASIIPLLPLIGGCASKAAISAAGVVQVEWHVRDRGILHVMVNLTDRQVQAPAAQPGEVLWQEGTETSEGLGAWFVRWMFRADTYAAHR